MTERLFTHNLGNEDEVSVFEHVPENEDVQSPIQIHSGSLQTRLFRAIFQTGLKGFKP